jgi:hypothetical protein
MNPAGHTPATIVAWGLISTTAIAQIPALISNQGRLYDGSNMVDGTVTMVLRVFPQAEGGE